MTTQNDDEEQHIAQALESLLHDFSSSATATAPPPPLPSLTAVLQHLKSKLGVDLSHKTDFIRSQLQLLLFQNDHFALQQPPPPTSFPDNTAVSTNHAEVATASEQSGRVASSKGKRRGGPGGLNKLCGVSPQLEAIVGQPTLPRTEIVKQLWAYIRKNNLQEPNNRRKIICNDELRLVFETDSTDMFKMNKLLAKHIIPLEPTKQPATPKRQRVVEEEAETRQAAVPAPSVTISEALANFFGVDGRQMLQSEVFTRLWQYININNLEDPLNRMVILCDAKLQELFGCQTLPASRIPEFLARDHIFRA